MSSGGHNKGYQTVGQERRGPQVPKRDLTPAQPLPESLKGWWASVGTDRDEFKRRLKEREQFSWGSFGQTTDPAWRAERE